jgi:hypothetical protein
VVVVVVVVVEVETARTLPEENTSLSNLMRYAVLWPLRNTAKVTVHATRAYRRRRCIAPFILSHDS